MHVPCHILTKSFTWGAVFLVSCLVSCNQSDSHGKLDPQVSAKLIRFEEELLLIDTLNASASYQTLYERHPVFTDLFLGNIVGSSENNSDKARSLKEILTDPFFRKLLEDASDEFSDFSHVKKELDQALENYVKTFEGIQTIPNIYSFVSGFNYQCFVFNDLDTEGVGIGLDMFMGSDFPYHLIQKDNPSFSSYLTRAYNKDHVAKKVVEVLVEDKLPPPQKSDFLSLMIWGGKKLYILDHILDFVPDTVITEYTTDQLSWCRDNELEMWDYFFENDLFYETDLNIFGKLVAPSPFSPGMPDEAPGRTGNYMGWRIVESLMKRNPDYSMDDLVRMNDAQEILNQSKFKPGR